MKKAIILTLLAVVAIFTTNAQTSIIFGPEAGYHFSKASVSGDFDIQTDFPTMDVEYGKIGGLLGGLTFGVQMDKWALLTGLKFNQKGGKVTVTTRDPQNPFLVTRPDGTQTTDVGEYTIETKSNWMSIPVLARGQFGGESFKFGLAIGPQINLAMGKYKETEIFNLDNNNLPNNEEEYNYGNTSKELLKKSHVSLVIQPHISYQINDHGSIRFGATIESGSNMVNDNYIPEGSNFNIEGTKKNSSFGFHIAYEHRIDLEVGVKY